MQDRVNSRLFYPYSHKNRLRKERRHGRPVESGVRFSLASDTFSTSVRAKVPTPPKGKNE